MFGKDIGISLSKGGVGKTTTAINLAAALTKAGRQVLLVDTDTQGQVAQALGIQPKVGLYELVMDGLKPKDVLIEARDNLFLIAGGDNLARLKRSISQAEYEGEYTLAKALEPFNRFFHRRIFPAPWLPRQTFCAPVGQGCGYSDACLPTPRVVSPAQRPPARRCWILPSAPQ